MSVQYERTELLLGTESLRRLREARVILFGVGGVGSFAAEALIRAGVGHLTLVDGDTVVESNLNRQLVALHSTLGMNKAEVMVKRGLDIDPELDIKALPVFYTSENAELVDFSQYDYAADAIDSVSAKLLIIQRCIDCNTPVISSMGAGNRLESRFEVRDIFSTSGDPLARVMRRELRKLGIARLNVVCSTEEPRKSPVGGCGMIGSVSFVPSSAGLVLAGKIIRDLTAI